MNALLLGQDKTCVLNERFLLIGTRQSNLCYMNAFKNWDKTNQSVLYERFLKIGTRQSNICYMNALKKNWDRTKQCVLYERFFIGTRQSNVCYMNAFYWDKTKTMCAI